MVSPANCTSEAKQDLSSINLSVTQLKIWNEYQDKGTTENLEDHKLTRCRQMLMLIFENINEMVERRADSWHKDLRKWLNKMSQGIWTKKWSPPCGQRSCRQQGHTHTSAWSQVCTCRSLSPGSPRRRYFLQQEEESRSTEMDNDAQFVNAHNRLGDPS